MQGDVRITLCAVEAGDMETVMVKKLAKREGVDEMRLLRQIRHPDIVDLKQTFLDGKLSCLDSSTTITRCRSYSASTSS